MIGILLPPAIDRSDAPTSAMTEGMLLAGYRHGFGLDMPGFREEPCACGGLISSRDSDRAIAYAVELHNATDRHLAWRRRRVR